MAKQGPIFQGPDFRAPEVKPHRNWLEKVGGFIAARTAQEKGALITVFGSFSLALFLSLTTCSRVSTENAVLKHDTQNMVGKIRDQDTTILKLSTEKASLENRLATFASIPLQVPSIISSLDNLLATEPTNQQQLLSLLYSVEALTNALSEATLRPTFDLYINKIKITNDTVLQLTTSRTLNMQVRNTSAISLEQLEIAFAAPLELDPTNLDAPTWRLEPQPLAVVNSKETDIPDGNQWSWRADSLVNGIPGNSNPGKGKVVLTGIYNVNYLHISTNFPRSRLPTSIKIYAARSKTMIYSVMLLF